MYIKKTLQELTLKDNFMFGAVMSEEANCRRLLELILGFPIARIEVSKERSITYHPEYKGVRLDVYAADENNTRYNVEMQAAAETSLGSGVCECGSGSKCERFRGRLREKSAKIGNPGQAKQGNGAEIYAFTGIN